MVADYSTDFQRYLGSVCTDDKYIECQEFYTPTDAVDPQPVQRRKFPLRRLNLGLQVRTVVPKEQEGQASEKVEQLPVREGLRKYQDNHVLLVGRPGSGKSTALQQLLWEEAQGIDLTPPAPLPLQGRGENYSPVRNKVALFPSPRRGGLGRGGEGLGERSTRGHAKIPVLVELRQYQTSVLDLIQAFLLRHELRLDIEEIKTLLIQGQFLLLLDGLNELPSVAWRELETFEQTYRQTAMIFTSRDVGRSLGRIKTLEMQALNEVQMRQFVCTYLPESGEEMLRQLGSRLRELGQTPLLLWMLCSVYAELGRVPTNLGAAFRAFAEIYDNQLKANVPTYQESQYWWSRLLKHLAFKMLQGESLTEPYLTISKPEAERVLRDFLQGKVAYPDDCAVRWLEDLLKYHLLQRETDNRIEFRHQLIQEYYAAEYLGERLADISNERLTWEYLNYLKWTQPLALMLALVEDEAQAVRVVRLALEVDLQLGARFAWEVKREFQEQTVGFVRGLEIPQIFKVRLLGMTRSQFAITTLCHALDDEDSYVRQSAALALGEIGNPEAVAALIAALNYKDSDVCQSAALALGKIGNAQLLPRFSKLLLTLATDKKYQLIWIIPEIQQRCRYYNYAIATSAPPQEQTTADPLSHSLNTLNQTLKTMLESETPKYDFSGASFTSFGSVTGDIKGDNIIGTQYNYPPEQKQNLAEAAKEIQQLLDQLAQTNPTLTESNNPIVVAEAIQQEIRHNPTFKQRLRSALKAGGIEALKAIFNHPLINIPIETIKGWIEAE